MSGQLKVYTRADRNGHRDIQSVSSQPLHGLEAKFDSFQSYAETMRISEPHNKPATKRLKGARHKAFALLLGYLPELAGQAFMAGHLSLTVTNLPDPARHANTLIYMALRRKLCAGLGRAGTVGSNSESSSLRRKLCAELGRADGDR